MKLFNLDSPVMVFLSKGANLMILNVLTIICCIPIFTAGAAITALYYVTIKMARGDDPYIIKGYFRQVMIKRHRSWKEILNIRFYTQKHLNTSFNYLQSQCSFNYVQCRMDML